MLDPNLFFPTPVWVTKIKDYKEQIYYKKYNEQRTYETKNVKWIRNLKNE